MPSLFFEIIRIEQPDAIILHAILLRIIILDIRFLLARGGIGSLSNRDFQYVFISSIFLLYRLPCLFLVITKAKVDIIRQKTQQHSTQH